MFRKFAFAAAVTLGMAGGLVATQSAEAAVMHPAASQNLLQTLQQSGPAAGVDQVQWHRPRVRRCWWQRVRVRRGHHWYWTNRRVCRWR